MHKSKNIINNYFNKNINFFQSGLNLPNTLINNLILTEKDKDELLLNEYKNKIFDYIKEIKKVYLLDISKHFELDILDIKYILNKLEEEGKIKIRDG